MSSVVGAQCRGLRADPAQHRPGGRRKARPLAGRNPRSGSAAETLATGNDQSDGRWRRSYALELGPRPGRMGDVDSRRSGKVPSDRRVSKGRRSSAHLSRDSQRMVGGLLLRLRRVPGAVGTGERLDPGRLLDWKPGRHRPEGSFSYRVVQPEVRRRGQL